MNVQRIFNVQTNIIMPVNSKTKANNSVFGIKMANPVERDTVSFKARGSKAVTLEVKAALARKQARALRNARLISDAKFSPEKAAPTKKKLSGEERKGGLSKRTAQQIRNMILEPQLQIHNFVNNVFGDLKVSEIYEKNLLLNIKDRAKSVISIMEKSATRGWDSIKENLENMTDLNGAKFVMNFKTGKEDVEIVLDRFIPLIKMKQITLKEIELQRPSAIKTFDEKKQEEYDYVSKTFLDKLEDVQEEVINGTETDVDNIVLVDRPLPKYTKSNYCALHLLFQLNEKGSRPFELQIMGAREDKGKLFDDKTFKYFNEKEIEKKYAELIQLWEPLKAEENSAAKEEFLKYCREAILQLREDERREHDTQRIINRSTGFFKTVREYNLTPEYDLNEQYKIMLRCDAKPNDTTKNEITSESTKNKNNVKDQLLSHLHLDRLVEKFGIKHNNNKNNKIKL